MLMLLYWIGACDNCVVVHVTPMWCRHVCTMLVCYIIKMPMYVTWCAMYKQVTRIICEHFMKTVMNSMLSCPIIREYFLSVSSTQCHKHTKVTQEQCHLNIPASISTCTDMWNCMSKLVALLCFI